MNVNDCEVVTVTNSCIKSPDGKLWLRVHGKEMFDSEKKKNLAQHNMNTEWKTELHFKHSALF